MLSPGAAVVAGDEAEVQEAVQVAPNPPWLFLCDLNNTCGGHVTAGLALVKKAQLSS